MGSGPPLDPGNEGHLIMCGHLDDNFHILFIPPSLRNFTVPFTNLYKHKQFFFFFFLSSFLGRYLTMYGEVHFYKLYSSSLHGPILCIQHAPTYK